MKKKSLRVLSLIVAIVMVVAMLPLSALAEKLNDNDPNTRQVGVVVYGAELTAVLAQVEKGLKGEMELKEALQLLTNITTKVADGTGVSVPDVDVELKAPDGTTYKMVEDTSIAIISDTMDVYFGFQTEVDKQLSKLESDLAGLRAAMKASNDLTQDMANMLDAFDKKLKEAKTQFENLKDTLVEGFNEGTGINGTLYRTYVTEVEVPVGKGYEVYLKDFTDEDENGNPVTRDGYVLYNDGLDVGGSKFNTERTFSVDIIPKDRFGTDIQFVGPGVGIEGSLKLPEVFGNAYDGFVTVLNKMLETAESIKNATTDNAVVSWAADLITAGTNTKPLWDWFKAWTATSLSKSSEIPKDYHILFPGLWCAEYDAGFSFRNVDVGENPVAGSEFVLINRQELLDVLKFMKDLGKDAFEGALKATFGGEMTYATGNTVPYEGITDLYAELLNTEEGSISLNYDKAYAIVRTYLGVILDMQLMERVIEKDTSTIVPTYKLKYPIPAILVSESDDDGIVTFKKSNNKTLTWILEILPTIGEYATKIIASATNAEEEPVANLFVELMDVYNLFVAEATDVIADAVNLLVYPFAQRLGLVGPKLASGEYLMFQTKAADGYWINPIAYTMDITWHSEGTTNEDWYYSTVADMGLIGPYFAEGFYDFVRDTTFAGTIDKFLGQAIGKDVNVVSEILNGKIDVTTEAGKVAMSALTAFATQIGFKSLGADKLFASKSDLLTDLNKYLVQNGQTAQNLMVYLNRLAIRSKTVYTGKVDNGWYFYNIDKSPTLTATKLIKKSTDDLVNATAVEIRKPVIQKAGDTVKSIVETVGNKVEETAHKVQAKIKETIGQAIKSVAQKAFDSIKSSVVNFFKGLFNRGMITFNA